MNKDWKEYYKSRCVSFADVAKQVKSGDFIGIGLAIGACSPPMFEAILARGEELKGVQICDSVPVRPSKLYDVEVLSKLDGHVNYNPCFGMMLSRKINEAKLSDFRPLMSSDGGDKYAMWSDVFICMTTPPNSQGYVNLGLTNFYHLEAIRRGRQTGKLRVAVAEVNDQMPTIFGNNWLHVSEFDWLPPPRRPRPGRFWPQRSFFRAMPG